MKYCTKCGHELRDEAVICPSCGCAINGGGTTAIQQVYEPEKLKSMVDRWYSLTYVGGIVSAICFFLSLASLILFFALDVEHEISWHDDVGSLFISLIPLVVGLIIQFIEFGGIKYSRLKERNTLKGQLSNTLIGGDVEKKYNNAKSNCMTAIVFDLLTAITDIVYLIVMISAFS